MFRCVVYVCVCMSVRMCVRACVCACVCACACLGGCRCSAVRCRCVGERAYGRASSVRAPACPPARPHARPPAQSDIGRVMSPLHFAHCVQRC